MVLGSGLACCRFYREVFASYGEQFGQEGMQETSSLMIFSGRGISVSF